MKGPSLCVVFNNVDDTSGIGKLCAWSVRTALDAGWRVSVIARDLAPELRDHVEWSRLYVPPRLHAVQWYAALPTVRRAMAGRTWDVVHVSQPQLVPVADVLQLHYIVRAAREHAPPAAGDLRSRIGAAQARLTELGEDRVLGRLPSDLTLMPVTAFLAEEFARLYGQHERTVVVDSPAPRNLAAPSDEQRRAARHRLVGNRRGMVIGFLGGADPRKGGRQLLDAVAATTGVTVLYAGSGLPDHPLTADRTRVVPVGYVDDLQEFLAACDGLAVVSTWDPGPLTALEAAAAGVPVIGTSMCGIVRDLVRRGGALPWEHGQPLKPVLSRMAAERTRVRAGARGVLAERTEGRQGRLLLEAYSSAACRTGRARPRPTQVPAATGGTDD